MFREKWFLCVITASLLAPPHSADSARVGDGARSSQESARAVHEVQVVAGRFAFEPATLHVVAGEAVRVVTIDTGVLFPETLATWRAFEERFGVKIEVQDASNPDNPWSGPEHCCSAAKVAALEGALTGAEGWITGIRREQGPTRAGTQLIERDDRRGLWKYNPLAHWSDKDLWRRIHERDLPYNPLHDQGYESIGCAPCTQPGHGREGRWAGTEKTECGLHVEVVE
jgi:phosphoadenosine phosphosulfate reductase